MLALMGLQPWKELPVHVEQTKEEIIFHILLVCKIEALPVFFICLNSTSSSVASSLKLCDCCLD